MLIPWKTETYLTKMLNWMIKSRLLWHRRLGHFYHENLNKHLALHSIKVLKCLDCQVSQTQEKSSLQELLHKKLQVFWKQFTQDVIGPIQPSFIGRRFILTFVDDYYSRK